jgi:signal transduction histidine kinase
VDTAVKSKETAMADIHAQLDGMQGLLLRGGAATTVGMGLAFAADFLLTRAGATIDSVAGWSVIAALIALSSAAGFALARSLTKEQRAAGEIEAATLARDLRTPLATARTNLQLLQSGALGPLDDDSRDTAARALSAVARAQSVLERTLRNATIEAPTTSLDAALDSALEAIAGGIAQSGAIIERGELPVVRADAEALERVLVNLVANSLAHSRPGQPPRIEVDARQEGRGWLVSVRDNGPGMSPSIREQAFEPGVRGFSPEGPAGFGLGLATVRRLVEQQGGRAWIDPDTTEGTCVRILLPAA